MLALLTGATGRLQGTSKKSGKPYDFYNLHAVWRDDSLGGFSAPPVYIEPPVFLKRVQPWLESSGTFPILSNLNFDSNGHLISLDLLETTREDIERFIFEE